jgi:hypothetical protein
VNTWKVILATFVIFAAGALTGGLMVRYSEIAKPGTAAKPGSIQNTNSLRGGKLPAPMMGPLRKDFVDRLQRELNMDAAQRERIERTIRDGQEITRLIWLEVEPDIFHTITETKDKIRAELSPEQLVRFEELLKSKHKTAPPPATNAPAPVSAMTNSAPACLPACLKDPERHCAGISGPFLD